LVVQMNKIEFVDQTIRDAQQSLWGNMMRTDHMLPIAETMGKVGYRAVATVGSQAFTIQVRNHNENPWERIRSLAQRMPQTCLRGSFQTASLSSFDLSTPRSIIELWIRRSIANGVRSFWICDYQENMPRFQHFARIARAEGAEVVTALMYTSSPAHTDEHWAQKVSLIEESKDLIDRIMIEDASGVMTPERTKHLISIIRRNTTRPLEFHCHCNSGLAPLCYLEAVQAGVTTLHTAVLPLANGTSLPAIESMLKNIRRLGFDADIDEEALAAVSAHFRKIAESEKLPVGAPVEYDLFHFEHQVPGGMMTNLTRQLREVGMETRLDEILPEVIRVRKEFGYPVMATPYSQIVGAQAVENVISGERYKTITDESIKYALEYYGKPVTPLDPNVMDRIMSLPRTKEFLNWNPEGYFKSVDELRSEIGPDLSDDDLLLKILIPGIPAKRRDPERPAVPAKTNAPLPAGPGNWREFPSRFDVEVDGEVFSVKIAPIWGDVQDIPVQEKTQPEQAQSALPPGAVLCGMAGLVLSIPVQPGTRIEKDDLLATIEAMKMRRRIVAPRPGVVKEVRAKEGEIVDAADVLVVLE
jgi:pyruvate/oxaloacetate carboxyltransferase/biotin carboxyl carrier protein